MRAKEKNYKKNSYLFKWTYSFFYQQFLCSAVSVITLLSCQSLSPHKIQSIPKNLSLYQSAFLSGIMEVQHQNTTQNILFDIMISKAGKLRMDLTAVLNIPLMTVSITSEGLSTILFFSTQQYYRGMHPEKLAGQFFIPQLNWKLLKDILLDRRPVQKTWVCGYNEETLPIQCSHQNVHIKWTRKTDRNLLLKTKEGQIKLHYKQFRPFSGEDIPELSIPKYFKPIQSL